MVDFLGGGASAAPTPGVALRTEGTSRGNKPLLKRVNRCCQDNALELRSWDLYGPLLLCLLLGTVLSWAAPYEQKPLFFIVVFLVRLPRPR